MIGLIKNKTAVKEYMTAGCDNELITSQKDETEKVSRQADKGITLQQIEGLFIDVDRLWISFNR